MTVLPIALPAYVHINERLTVQAAGMMAVSVGNMAHPTPGDAPIPALHGLHLTEGIT